MSLNAATSLVLLRNLLAKTVDAFRISGSATRKMIAETDQTKEISAQKKLVPTFNLRVLERVIAFRNHGCATVMMIVSINR